LNRNTHEWHLEVNHYSILRVFDEITTVKL
jgi:hypothetical protein